MPFTKIGKNKNVSPSGRVFTDKQVKLYYATDGFKNMDEEEMKTKENNTNAKMKKKDLVEYIKFKKDGGYKKYKKSELTEQRNNYDFPTLPGITGQETRDILKYLEKLRLSGLTNMFGAHPILNWAKDDLERWLYGMRKDLDSLEEEKERITDELEYDDEDSMSYERDIESIEEEIEIIEYLLDNKRKIRDILIRAALAKIDQGDGNHETGNVQRVFEKMAKDAWQMWVGLLNIG